MAAANLTPPEIKSSPISWTEIKICCEIYMAAYDSLSQSARDKAKEISDAPYI